MMLSALRMLLQAIAVTRKGAQPSVPWRKRSIILKSAGGNAWL